MSVEELSDAEKAAALDDLIRSFKKTSDGSTWWDVDGYWVTIDGSGIVSPETADALSRLWDEAPE